MMKFSRSGLVAGLCVFLIRVACVAGGLAIGLRAWVILVGLVPVVVATAWLRRRLRRFVADRWAPRPSDLSEEDWTLVRRAREQRAAGDIYGASETLGGVAESRSVAVLRELLRMDQAAEGEPDYVVERVVFEAEFEPDARERGGIARACAEWPIEQFHALFDRRAALIDAVLEGVDEAEAAPILERVAGLGPEADARAWWRRVRPLWTGDEALTGLVVRLWRMEAYEAAELIAHRAVEHGASLLLPEEAHLLELLHRLAEGRSESIDLEEDGRSLLLLPQLCDVLGLLLLGGPVLGESLPIGRVIERLKLRLAVVGHLVRLWEDYEFDLGVEASWLLFHLTGHKIRMLRARARFAKWWEAERERQHRHDEAFVRGLHAASEAAWESASSAFGEAERILPDRTSASFNRACAERESGRPERAEPLLARLAARDPKEPYWWVELGDLRRSMGRPAEALEAYAHAVSVPGLAKAMAFRMGLALADEGRDEDAAVKINEAIGARPQSELLEQISRFLESEGAHRLARRYREEAFRRSLEESLEYPRDDEDHSSN